MEVNPADATVQQAHKMEEASDVGSSANESAQAVAAGTEPTTSETEALTASTAAEPKQARTPTSDSAPSVDNLEDGLVRLGITPSPSPPPAHHLHAATPSTGFPRSDYVPPLPGTGMDATNVFIKYLPTDLTNTGLYTLFSQFGEITSCKVMVDPITGYSLGYGYVTPSSTPPYHLRLIHTLTRPSFANTFFFFFWAHGILEAEDPSGAPIPLFTGIQSTLSRIAIANADTRLSRKSCSRSLFPYLHNERRKLRT